MLSLDTIRSPGDAALASDEQGCVEPMFANVLRSKGTVWLDSQHRMMASWSHAGRHFRLDPAGAWWATVPEPIMMACLSADGTTKEPSAAFEAERAHFETAGGGFGDRRQEIVFIGTELDEGKIGEALDSCLASDAELAEYRAVWAFDEQRMVRQAGPFRFEVGQQVECCLGEGRWETGVVVEHYYRRPQWPPERWMPYLVKLNDGELIWAPADVDDRIRAAS